MNDTYPHIPEPGPNAIRIQDTRLTLKAIDHYVSIDDPDDGRDRPYVLMVRAKRESHRFTFAFKEQRDGILSHLDALMGIPSV